jgi:hypothetical protein
MSTKTVTKRVALATVVALGAGVLSLVSVTSANAAPNNLASANTVAAGNPIAANQVMNIATVASTTGAAVVGSVANGAAALSDGRSLGLLNWGDVTGGVSAGTTQTATILSTGALVLYTTSTNAASFVVSGGTITAQAGGQVSSSLTAAACSATASNGYCAVSVKPNTGVTSFTVSMYNYGTSANDTAASILAGTDSVTAVLNGKVTVAVGSASLSGAVSATNSGVWYTGAINPTGLTNDSATLSNPGVATTGSDLYANIRIRDAYGSALTGAGLLQASATNGAIINLATTTPGAGTQSTAFVSIASGASADNYVLDVEAPTAAPVSTVVTVTYNGTVIGTKSFSFYGSNVAKISLSGAVNGKTNNSTGNTATISFADAAGNTLYPTAALFTQDAASYGNGVITGVTLSTPPVSGTIGKIAFACGASSGTANIDVKYTNTDGSVITSNALPVTCSDKPATYTAAYDKSSYNLGDIATLLVTFKDTKGNLANDVDTLTSYVAPTVSSAGLTPLSGPSAGDKLANGVVKYTYTVGNSIMSTGTFTNSISFATPDATAKAAFLSTGPATATLTINATAGTSLNDVLKGIVSLIASINKQIAALAKLVTKK